MNIKTSFLAICLSIFSILSFNVSAADIFSDSFESINMSETNKYGFKWEANNRTSVVTQDSNGEPVAVYNNGSIYKIKDPVMPDGSPRNYIAKTGSYALRFMYPAGQTWSEQRFGLGTAMREVVIKFWLRVPLNFSYGTKGSPAMNNKFFAIWMDGYETSGEGSTVWLGMYPINTHDATLAYSYSKGNYTGSGGFQQTKPFITTADRGRWMQIVFRVKAESSEGANDGIVQTYRRWSGENKFTKMHEDLNAPLHVPHSGPNGFIRGYILGWSNATYNNDTEWLLDDFVVSDSLGDLIGKIPKSPTTLVTNQ